MSGSAKQPRTEPFPLHALPDSAFAVVLSKLDAKTRCSARLICKDWMHKINTTQGRFTLNLVEGSHRAPIIDYNKPEVQRQLTAFVTRHATNIKRVFICCSLPADVLQSLFEIIAPHNALEEVQDQCMRVLQMPDKTCIYNIQKLWLTDIGNETHQPIFLALLPHLTNLRSLFVHGRCEALVPSPPGRATMLPSIQCLMWTVGNNMQLQDALLHMPGLTHCYISTRGFTHFTITPDVLRNAVPNVRQLHVQLCGGMDDIHEDIHMFHNVRDVGVVCILLEAWAHTLEDISIEYRGGGIHDLGVRGALGATRFPTLGSLTAVRKLRLEGVDLHGRSGGVLQLPTLQSCSLKHCAVAAEVLEVLPGTLARFASSEMIL